MLTKHLSKLDPRRSVARSSQDVASAAQAPGAAVDAYVVRTDQATVMAGRMAAQALVDASKQQQAASKAG